jgi:hypothetical protein
MKCNCGAFTCRQIIRDFYWLPEEVQQRYLRLDIVQSFIVRHLQAGKNSLAPFDFVLQAQRLQGGERCCW